MVGVRLCIFSKRTILYICLGYKFESRKVRLNHNIPTILCLFMKNIYIRAH